MITDKPCLAHLRDGTFAVIKQIYPTEVRPLTGSILKSCPSERDGFRLHVADHPHYSWLPDGAVVSCNPHHYDIMEVSPLPHEALADRFEDLREQIRLLTKKEALTRARCNELYEAADAVVSECLDETSPRYTPSLAMNDLRDVLNKCGRLV